MTKSLMDVLSLDIHSATLFDMAEACASLNETIGGYKFLKIPVPPRLKILLREIQQEVEDRRVVQK